ncbi:transcriptional regulator, LacI family [Pseudarthrobacter equi]|jgi:LacI family transcriptional regulator|uniref:Transcriptional regulator, LacI family n=2 Tax=Pseudarthrobacter equi TaxID=728066 RepID=A0A1H1TJW8_9MICC|nr:transcriptional regulator, LacI family [Pseudarthrobacter equi]
MTSTPYSSKTMATYKDIQRLTGLSLSTISKYYNGGSVRQSNGEAIQRAADELGFQINDFARSLRRGTSQTVGVLLPALDNGFHLAIIAGVEKYLQVHGVGVIVVSSHPEERRPGGAVDALRSKRVDGIVAVPSVHDAEALKQADEAGIPVVTVDRTFPGLETDHVQLDNYAAGAMVAHYLLDHRHKRIAIIGGDHSVPSLTERHNGFLDALEQRGVDREESWSSENDLTIEAGRRAVRLLLARGNRPTAMFAANYELTVGALIGLNESGLVVPDDMSFVGFDIAEIAQVTRPPMATVVQPMAEIAEHAARRILARMNSSDAPRDMQTLPADLRTGSSVRHLGQPASTAT